jgi:hypothetical protein
LCEPGSWDCLLFSLFHLDRTWKLSHSHNSKPTRRVPQVRCWNLGLAVAFLSLVFHVDRHQPRCFSVVKPQTAPPPISRMFHQSANHRIRVQVVQLLPFLSLAVHIEIVRPRLPERSQRLLRHINPKDCVHRRFITFRRFDSLWNIVRPNAAAYSKL